MIPVQRPYIGKEELEAVGRVFESRWLGMGSVTEDFESKLQEFLGAKHVIAVNSGTSALHIVLDSLDISENDEVIVPSLTFVASVQAIMAARAKPVFCDICEDTLNMSIEDTLTRISDRTKVIMPVHYGGCACEIDELLRIARKKNILIVEDAAHAFGSTYKGRKVGTLGDVTCFSFDPIKNITCGEGGAVVTEDGELAHRVIAKRMLGIDRNTGSGVCQYNGSLYDVVMPGHRYHMSDINAAIGLEQFKRLEVFKQRKQQIVRCYNKAFGHIGGLRLRKTDADETFPFFYVLRVLNGRRDDLMAYLKARGIVSGVHYVPNHLHRFFATFKTSLPVCERVYKEIITLPLYYEMTDDDVAKVITAVRSFFQVGTGRIHAVSSGHVKVNSSDALVRPKDS